MILALDEDVVEETSDLLTALGPHRIGATSPSVSCERAKCASYPSSQGSGTELAGAVSLERLVSRVQPGVVRITRSRWASTGMVLGERGFRVTNAHVADCGPVAVASAYGVPAEAAILAANPARDLALIRAPDFRAEALPLGPRDSGRPARSWWYSAIPRGRPVRPAWRGGNGNFGGRITRGGYAAPE